MTAAHGWLRRIVDGPALEALAGGLRAPGSLIARGSWGSGAALVAGALAVKLARPVLLAVAHLDEADDAYEDLALFPAAGYALERQRFPALEVLPGESSPSLELLAERLAVVERLVGRAAVGALAAGGTADARQAAPGVLAAPIQALMQPVPEPQALGEFSVVLEAGKAFNPARLLDWLDRAGYSRADAIEAPGDFATRGGIIDLYLGAGRGPTRNRGAPSPALCRSGWTSSGTRWIRSASSTPRRWGPRRGCGACR